MKFKKGLLFSVLLVIGFFLLGCESKPEKVDMSYEDALQVFQENIENFKITENFTKIGEFLEELDLNLVLESGLANGDIELKYDNNENKTNKESQKNIILKGNLDDLLELRSYKIDLFAKLLSFDTESFVNIPSATIDMGEGSYEGTFINSIIDSIKGQWIQFDTIDQEALENINLEQLNKIENLSGMINSYELTEYEGKTAYKLELNDNSLVDVRGELLPFIDTQAEEQKEAYLVVNGLKDVYFLSKLEKENSLIDIRLGNNKLIINMYENDKLVGEGEIKANKGYFDINFDGKEDDKTIFEIMGTVSVENRDGASILDIKMTLLGDIVSNYMQIDQGTDKSIKLVLEGLYSLIPSTGLTIEKPTDYVLMNDLLGDSFGMPYMMGMPELETIE